MKKSPWIAAFILVPVLAGAFFSLARLVSEGSDVPSEQHYQEVQRFLSSEMGDDDGLVLLPAWTLRPLVHFKTPHWEPGDDISPLNLRRYRTLFVLVEPDGQQGLQRLQSQYGERLEVAFEAGPIQILKATTLPEQQVGVDFRALLDDKAKVQLHKKNEVMNCSLHVQGGWRCPGKDAWQRVNREWQLVTENGRPAIWAHPPRPGEKITIRFDHIELGKELFVSGGFSRKASTRAKAPATLRAYFYEGLLAGADFVEGKEHQNRKLLGEKKFPVGFSWDSAAFSTSQLLGQKGAVVFEVTSEDYRQGHFAFDAMLVGGGLFSPLPPPARSHRQKRR